MARYFGVPLRNGLPIGLGSVMAMGNPRGAPAPIPDPYYDYTTLLLPGNGTNGAQNNTFLDSSSNAFSITRNGNTTQGTFSPFSQTGWSAYFDGSGDYINFTNQGTTSSFTCECWFYCTANASGGYHILFGGSSNAGANNSQLYINNTGGIGIAISGTSIISATGTAAAQNTWNHVAFVRSGSSIALFVNGNRIATGTSSLALNVDRIGNNNFPGYEPIGYISNARITTTAVYDVTQTTYTVPTTPLTAISGTYLLTCQSNRFIDNSTNAFAITRNGDVSVQAFSPFNPTAVWSAATNGGSAYFDGSGDYLTVPDSTAFTMGTGNFSVECWYYPTSAARQVIVSQSNGAGTVYSFWMEKNPSNQLRIIATVGGVQYIATATATMNLNAWNFLQLVRNGTTLYGYQNGVEVCSVAVGSGSVLDSTDNVTIGEFGAGSGLPVVGYISDVRILKGTASTATVPTAPLTAITNTSLLLNFTNAGIYDATSKNDLETVGNAQISTTQSKFGGSSMYFDGTGDWLLAPSNAIYDFGTGDFTVEFWARFDSVGSLIYFITEGTGINGAPNLKTAGWCVIYSSPNLQFQRYDGTTQTIYSFAWTPVTGTWYHVAMSRYASSLRCFINGVQIGSTQTSTDSFNRINTTDPLTIGTGISGGNPGANYSFNGYMQDIRITKGIARYTSNFTPPSTAFPTL